MGLYDKKFHRHLSKLTRATGKTIARRPFFTAGKIGTDIRISYYVAVLIYVLPLILAIITAQTNKDQSAFISAMGVVLIFSGVILSVQVWDKQFYLDHEHLPVEKTTYIRRAIRAAAVPLVGLLFGNVVVIAFITFNLTNPYPSLLRCIVAFVCLTLIQCSIAVFAIRFLRKLSTIKLLSWGSLIVIFFSVLAVLTPVNDVISHHLPTAKPLRFIGAELNPDPVGLSIWSALFALGAISLIPFLKNTIGLGIVRYPRYEEIVDETEVATHFPEITLEELRKRNQESSLLTIAPTKKKDWIEKLIHWVLTDDERMQLNVIGESETDLAKSWLLGWPIMLASGVGVLFLETLGVIISAVLFNWHFLSYRFREPNFWLLDQDQKRYSLQLKVLLVRLVTALPIIFTFGFAVGLCFYSPIRLTVVITAPIVFFTFDRVFWWIGENHSAANLKAGALRFLLVALECLLWPGLLTMMYYYTFVVKALFWIPFWLIGFCLASIGLARGIIALQNRALLTPAIPLVEDFEFD